MNDIIISALVTAFCSGGLVWIFTVKYTRKQAQADAMKSVQEVYQTTIQDMKQERTELKSEIKELKKEVAGNTQDIKEMKPFLCYRRGCMDRLIKQQVES